MLNALAKEIHENAVNHGWWEEPRELPEILMLCVSELSEALEEYRNGKPASYFLREASRFPQYQSHIVDETDLSKIGGNKPEGVAVELADCIIRILDYCAKEDIDIDGIIRIKHKYNKSRPYRHGGKIC